MTSSGFNGGWAAMPQQGRLSHIDAQDPEADLFDHQRRHREAMARNKPPDASSLHIGDQSSQWDDAEWDQDHDEAAGHRARQLLSGSSLGLHRLGDGAAASRRWLRREPWVKRLAIVVAVLLLFFAAGFGGLWWRLGAGPINLEMATPWLAAA